MVINSVTSIAWCPKGSCREYPVSYIREGDERVDSNENVEKSRFTIPE